MNRLFVLLFGTVNYLCFLGVFLYAIGFVGGFLVPTTLDGAPRGSWYEALAINLALIALFGVQHSVMARPWFKEWWTRVVPQPIERSTYVLCTNAALAVLFWQWRSTGGVVWQIESPLGRALLWTLFGTGWVMVLVTTFLINHFDLFGLRQVWMYFRGQTYRHLPFATPGPYRFVRHPLYVGWLLAFWATPTMTAAHFAFALGMTAYILAAIPLEERDLIRLHGRRYAEYRQRVGMLLPGWKKAPAGDSLSQTRCDSRSSRPAVVQVAEDVTHGA